MTGVFKGALVCLLTLTCLPAAATVPSRCLNLAAPDFVDLPAVMRPREPGPQTGRVARRMATDADPWGGGCVTQVADSAAGKIEMDKVEVPVRKRDESGAHEPAARRSARRSCRSRHAG